jgi:hypothetical protein
VSSAAASSDSVLTHFTATVREDGRSMFGKGELSKDGPTWEKDLELAYARAE